MMIITDVMAVAMMSTVMQFIAILTSTLIITAG
jgi:hypothetical protein